MVARRPHIPLTALIKQIVGEPTTGCEVGVWQGNTSFYLLDRFPGLFLNMVDCWHQGGSHKTMPKGTRILRRAHRLVVSRAKNFPGRCHIIMQESHKACLQIPDGSLDFVFLDAEHTYEQVTQDCPLWFPKVRVGGLIAGHDYLGTYMGKTYRGEVKRAVDEWAKKLGRVVETTDADIWYLGGKR